MKNLKIVAGAAAALAAGSVLAGCASPAYDAQPEESSGGGGGTPSDQYLQRSPNSGSGAPSAYSAPEPRSSPSAGARAPRSAVDFYGSRGGHRAPRSALDFYGDSDVYRQLQFGWDILSDEMHVQMCRAYSTDPERTIDGFIYGFGLTAPEGVTVTRGQVRRIMEANC